MRVNMVIGNVPSLRARISFFLQKCGAYLRAELNTIAIPLSTVFTRISASALIDSPHIRRLFEGGAYSSNNSKIDYQPRGRQGKLAIVKDSKTDVSL